MELTFQLDETDRGKLRFGFAGGAESAVVTLDFKAGRALLGTSEWTRPQPVVKVRMPKVSRRKNHTLIVEKLEGGGEFVKMARIGVILDGQELLRTGDLDILPEMGVMLEAEGVGVHLSRFVHRGPRWTVPEFLNLGGWQMLNRPSIEENLASIRRGLAAAAEAGVELMVTTETSLTGLFPTDRVTQDRAEVERAERVLREAIREQPNAPHVVVGMPNWEKGKGHKRAVTRTNVSRVYDPDGEVVSTHAKIHSCETEFHHGYRLAEFDVNGAPICMHICHDGRYPDVWTLPVMFGSRVIVHPSNGGEVSGSVDAFEAKAGRVTGTSHAFYLNVNGGGGSFIVSPSKYNNLLAVSDECRRDNGAFPMVGEAVECLFHHRIRVHEAFGYWPVRSFRASEAVGKANWELYRAMGGGRSKGTGRARLPRVPAGPSQ